MNGFFLGSQATVVELLASPEVEGSPELQNGGRALQETPGSIVFCAKWPGNPVKFGGFRCFYVSKRPLPELSGHRCGALGFL